MELGSFVAQARITQGLRPHWMTFFVSRQLEKQGASFQTVTGTPTKTVAHRGLKSHVESTGSNNMDSCSKNVDTEGVVQPESPLV